jgi:hypothetical protein
VSTRLTWNADEAGNRRVVVVILRLPDGKHQGQLRQALGGNFILMTRRVEGSSRAKREVESLFGKLRWEPAPESLLRSDPTALQVAYLNLGELQ